MPIQERLRLGVALELPPPGNELVERRSFPFQMRIEDNVRVTFARASLFADTNLDGVFDSTDLVEVFKAGTYEQDVDAGWEQGDWNGDRRFDSGDLIAAFQDGGYDQGRRSAVNAVPEPTSVFSVFAGGLLYLHVMRRRSYRTA